MFTFSHIRKSIGIYKLVCERKRKRFHTLKHMLNVFCWVFVQLCFYVKNTSNKTAFLYLPHHCAKARHPICVILWTTAFSDFKESPFWDSIFACTILALHSIATTPHHVTLCLLWDVRQLTSMLCPLVDIKKLVTLAWLCMMRRDLW